MSEQTSAPLTEDQRRTALDIAYLASCSLAQEAPDTGRVEGMDVSHVLAVAQRHSIDAICAMALERAGVQGDEVLRSVVGATRKAALFAREWERIRELLEAEDIWYAPLKGTVLKSFYPQPEMRQMCDIDVLFDVSRAQDVRQIMEGLGYDVERFGWSAHDVYMRKPVYNVEMHRLLTNAPEKSAEAIYLAHVVPGDKLIRADDGLHAYHMSDDDFYLYVQIHAYRHFKTGGTGLRSFMDTYVMLQHLRLNESYVNRMLAHLDMGEFDARARSLATHLFGGQALTLEDEQMLAYVLGSGTYGTLRNRTANGAAKHGGGMRGKTRYALGRFTSNPDDVKLYFPFFYRHRILLPFLPLYRLARSMADSDKRHRLGSELRSLLRG